MVAVFKAPAACGLESQSALVTMQARDLGWSGKQSGVGTLLTYLTRELDAGTMIDLFIDA